MTSFKKLELHLNFWLSSLKLLHGLHIHFVRVLHDFLFLKKQNPLAGQTVLIHKLATELFCISLYSLFCQWLTTAIIDLCCAHSIPPGLGGSLMVLFIWSSL